MLYEKRICGVTTSMQRSGELHPHFVGTVNEGCAEAMRELIRSGEPPSGTSIPDLIDGMQSFCVYEVDVPKLIRDLCDSEVALIARIPLLIGFRTSQFRAAAASLASAWRNRRPRATSTFFEWSRSDGRSTGSLGRSGVRPD